MGNVAWKWKTHIKEWMTVIDQEKLSISHSMGMGNVGWKWKTFSQRRDDID